MSKHHACGPHPQWCHIAPKVQGQAVLGPKCLNVATGLESQKEAHLVSGAWA